MAVINIEMVSAKFSQLVQFIASTGPIPIGILKGLGPTRLIAAFNWNQVEIGLNPPGFNPPPGVLTARCAIALRHVSIAELDANPNAAGTTTNATAWVSVSATSANLEIRLLAIQVPNTPVQWFNPAMIVARRQMPAISRVRIASAAFILHEEVVTLRFGTRATDFLFTTPANMVVGAGDEWAIHLPGDLFTEQLLEALSHALETPPDGTTIEDAPTASWEEVDGKWVAIGSVGLEKKNACPGLFGKVDISVTIDIKLTPEANLALPTPQLNLTLNLNTNASDWDSLRCWLGNGAIASVVLGYVSSPIISPESGGVGFLIAGLFSLITVGEIVRLQAGKELEGQTINDFTLVGSSSTSATYNSQNNLPSLLITNGGVTNGTISDAPTGSFGMLISGRINFLNATHVVTFNPPGGTLSSVLKNKYDCGRKTWLRKAEIQTIQVTDNANLIGSDLGPNLVEVFPSSTAIPANKWSVDRPTPDFVISVNIKGSESIRSGDGGRIYLHTSAGIRRYDIAPLPDIAAPSDEQTIAAVIRCLNKAKMFTPKEKIGWLIDPPHLVDRFEPLRQWLFTFASLPEATRITLHQVRNGVRNNDSISFSNEYTGQASFELLTDAGSDIVMEHNQEKITEGRVMQRWIMPLEVIDTGEAGQGMVRSGSLIAVIQRSGIFIYDLSTGFGSQQRGELRLSKLSPGEFEIIEQTRRLLGKAITAKNIYMSVKEDYTDEMPMNKTSFSLSLPGGKIAALFKNKLVIGVPSEMVMYSE